jgi:hypothetical protein
MNVRLHIERLILEGLDVPPGDALQLAVETELTRLIGERGLGALGQASACSIAVPSVRAPQIQVDASFNSVRTGTAIAAAVHGAIGGGE